MEENRKYSVYYHKFPDGQYYVGLTRQNVNSRWQNGQGYKNQQVYKEILYYGWDNIEHVVYKDNLTLNEAQELEKELIFLLDSINHGHNNDPGGGAGGQSWVLFEYNDDIYTPEELLQFSKVDGLTTHDLTTRINHHKWSIEEALTKPKTKRKNIYSYNGKEYTAKELYEIREYEDISFKAFASRLSNGWDIKRALSQPTNVKLEPYGCRNKEHEAIYNYNGKEYTTHELLQLSSVPDMTGPILYNRIIRREWDIDRALTQPLKKYKQKYEYNGELYTTDELLKLSPLEDITLHDITDRIRNGWSIDDVINKPKRKIHFTHTSQSEAKLDESSKSSLEGSETNS